MNKKIIFILMTIMISLNSTISYAAKSYFNDLQGYSWAEEYINDFAKNKIVSGVSEEKFEPGREVKREEFVKVIINLFEYDPYNAESIFEDVSKDVWYYPYVSAAVKEGIVNGISSTEFGSGKEISRQDMCVIIYRTLKNRGYTLKENSKAKMAFEDMDEISEYAKEAVEKLYKAGIINGVSDNSFAPKSNANRAQMVKVAYLCNKNKKEDKIVKVKSISFEEKEIEVEVGEEVHLDYTIKPDNASNKKVTWSTNSKTVVKLENGFITGLKSGKATITIKTENGKNATCKVTVKGDEEEKTSKPSGGGGGGESSSGGGNSSGGSGGSSGDGGGSSSSTTPTTVAVTGVLLNRTALILNSKTTVPLMAIVQPNNATNKSVTWESSNPNVVSIDDNGLLTVVGEGTATITVTTVDGGKTATCQVSVRGLTSTQIKNEE